MTYFLDIKVYSPSGKTIFSDTKSFPVLIGRDADNDVVLPADNSLISREHAPPWCLPIEALTEHFFKERK